MLFNQVANRTVEFKIVTGTVISSQKHSETHISSSGGGGYVHKGSGYVNAPRITSHVITKHEFWIRTEDGQEIPVSVAGMNILVAEGQTVSVITASVSDFAATPPVLIINHNAKGHWFIPPYAGFVNTMHEPIKFWPVIVIAISLVIGLVPHLHVLALAAIGFAFYRLFRRKRLASASIARLGKHMETIAQSAYSRPAVQPIALPALPPLQA